MKKLLVIAMLFISIVANSQQISELSKGLLFRWTGNEWDGNRDLISGSIGQSTDIYNVMDKSASGRREVVYNGSTSYTNIGSTIDNIFDAGATASVRVNPKSFTVGILITKTWSFYVSAISGGYCKVSIYYPFSTTYGQWTLTNAVIPINVESTISISYNNSSVSNDPTFYVVTNGVLSTYTVGSGVTEVSTPVGTRTSDAAANMFMGSDGSSNDAFGGSISMCRIFNYALTPTQITNYSKPEYPIEASDRDGAGNLCVLDLNAEGLAQSTSGYWYDRTNSTAPSYTSVAATNTATTLVIPPASNLSATSFNGTTSKVDMGDSDSFTLPNNNFSMSFGVRFTLLNTYESPITKYDTNSTREYIVQFWANGKIIVYLFSGGSASVNSVYSTITGLITNDIDYKIVVTYSNAICDIYINNVKYTTTVATEGGGFVSFLNSDSHLIIGSNVQDNQYVNGIISKVNFYKETLDSDRITLIKDTNF